MMEEGGDPSAILNKYLKPEEQGSIEGWEQLPDPGMKVWGSLAIGKTRVLVDFKDRGREHMNMCGLNCNYRQKGN